MNPIQVFLIVNVFLLLNYVEYEVKEEYTDNHVADKHSKAGHMFDEEMADVGKFGDVEMHEAATHTFQGMSNEVQSDKLDEEQDTTTGAHEGVNDRKETMRCYQTSRM